MHVLILDSACTVDTQRLDNTPAGFLWSFRHVNHCILNKSKTLPDNVLHNMLTMCSVLRIIPFVVIGIYNITKWHFTYILSRVYIDLVITKNVMSLHFFKLRLFSLAVTIRSVFCGIQYTPTNVTRPA